MPMDPEMVSVIVLAVFCVVVLVAIAFCCRWWQRSKYLGYEPVGSIMPPPFRRSKMGGASGGGRRGGPGGRSSNSNSSSGGSGGGKGGKRGPSRKAGGRARDLEFGMETAPNVNVLAANFCRDLQYYTWLDESYPCMGSRAAKYYFACMYDTRGEDGCEKAERVLVAMHRLTHQPHLLMTADLGDEQQLKAFRDVVYKVGKHPNLLPTYHTDYLCIKPQDDKWLVTARQVSPHGSLKDVSTGGSG